MYRPEKCAFNLGNGEINAMLTSGYRFCVINMSHSGHCFAYLHMDVLLWRFFNSSDLTPSSGVYKPTSTVSQLSVAQAQYDELGTIMGPFLRIPPPIDSDLNMSVRNMRNVRQEARISLNNTVRRKHMKKVNGKQISARYPNETIDCQIAWLLTFHDTRRRQAVLAVFRLTYL